MSKKHYIIPIFVPHRGCPNDCVFCNQKKITGLSTDITENEVDNIIKNYLKTIPKENSEIEVAFYGGSFTGIDIKLQKVFLNIVKNYKKKGQIHRIRLSTRPDYIDKERLNLLKESEVDTIELGVQSLDDEVLKRSLRGHTVEDVIKAVKLIKQYNFKIGLQMMIGLVGDTKDRALMTGFKIVKLKPDFTRIYPTLVVKDTYLEKMYESEKYYPLSINEAVEISSELLMLFIYFHIPVIRIGLQPTENITLGKDVVAGPFHPAFRQLVESKIYGIVLDEYFRKTKDKLTNIQIMINQRDIPNLAGHKSANIRLLKLKYGLEKIAIKSENIPKDYFYIKHDTIVQKIDKRKFFELYLIKRGIIKKFE